MWALGLQVSHCGGESHTIRPGLVPKEGHSEAGSYHVSMKGVLVAVLVLFGAGCGAAAYQSYQASEIDIASREATFARAQQGLRDRELPLLEEDIERGVVSTQWQLHGGKHYNLQVLISPVSSKVIIGCRIEHGLNLEECPASSGFPAALVKHAKSLTELLRAGESS